MNRLFILRHAKAGQHTSKDHERPLTEVGRTQARLLGEWFSAQGIAFDTVLTSSSLRTVETVEGLGLSIGFTIVPRLYSAPDYVIESVIQEAGIQSGNMLVVAHNPGVSDLVARAGYAGSLGTCTVVELEVPVNFTDFSAASCKAVSSYRPEV